jgi:hypothetical protein
MLDSWALGRDKCQYEADRGNELYRSGEQNLHSGHMQAERCD